jgi:UDP-glucose 4-epimerase
VTGGAGFIGSHIVDSLLAKGKPVRVIDNLTSDSLENLSQCLDNNLFEFIQADLLDKENLTEIVKDCDEI